MTIPWRYRLASAGWAWRRRKPVVTTYINRILVVRLCCIGDILFTTPLLRALDANYPRARIGYLVSPWCRDLVAANPRVDEVIEYDGYGTDRRLRSALTAVRRLRAGRYDLALILHRTPLAHLLAWAGGVPWRVGFDWQGRGFSLTHPVPYRARAHEVDRVLDCLQPLGAAADGTDLELPGREEHAAGAEALLHAHGWRDDQRPLVALFPGGGENPGTVMPTKRWDPAGFREIIRRLETEYRRGAVVFIGGRGDREVGDAVLSDWRPRLPVIRLEGQTDLLTTGAVLKHCDLFVGGDSGPLHMAAAAGVPTIALFGPTDPDRLAPRGRAHAAVRADLPCSPCFVPERSRFGDSVACRLERRECLGPELVDGVWDLMVERFGKRGIRRS